MLQAGTRAALLQRRRRSRRPIRTILVLVVVFSSIPDIALAYVDPGHGALLWQALAAAAAACAFYAVRFFRWARRATKRKATAGSHEAGSGPDRLADRRAD